MNWLWVNGWHSLETDRGIPENGSCGKEAATETSSTKRTSLMHIHCPHCRSPIEVVEDQELRDVTCPSCGSSFNLLPDETVTRTAVEHRTLGHFELMDRIGVGAFGEVWTAHDSELDRTVAIKLPRKGQLSAEEAESFLREARSAARLNHPSIVAVHEVGKADDQLFIVSDYVRGVTLADWLTGKRPTPKEAAELVAQLADAVQHAHEHGVIHRDLKPSNIMLDDDWPAAHHGLRPGQARGRRDHDDDGRQGPGHARLHVARAGQGRGPRCGCAQRRVFAGGDPV